jgi:hypothetical protein
LGTLDQLLPLAHEFFANPLVASVEAFALLVVSGLRTWRAVALWVEIQLVRGQLVCDLVNADTN